MSKRKHVAVLGLFLLLDDKYPHSKRKCWVKPYLARKALGCYDNLLREFALEDRENYRRWMRLDEASFLEILDIIRSDIVRKDTIMRAAIPPETRLAITLRYLATGKSTF